MALVAPILTFFSLQTFFTVHGFTQRIFRLNPWVPTVVWLGVLLLAMLRPLNELIAPALGAHRLSQDEEGYLASLWKDVMHTAGVRSNRYTLRTVGYQSIPLDRDLGPYIVTIEREAISLLQPEELSALLAQRTARQTIMLGPVLGICVWALVPLGLWLGLSVLALAILRGIYRTMFKAVDQAGRPRTEFEAGCALSVIAVGIAGFLAFVAVGAFALLFLIEAFIAVVIITSLAKWAERKADARATRIGYGPMLIRALSQLSQMHQPVSGWRGLLSTSSSPQERISSIEKSLFSVRT
jgi:hypothetical protein